MFNHLSDSEFEELTYDILVTLGFVNVSWRRGTGRGGATADQGRDVVGELRRQEVDRAEHVETWFVQCKHYERGVPPEAFSDAVAWAVAERPNVLLLVVSNFLSNSAKNWIHNYELNNHPAFRIKLWECKNLEQLVSSMPTVVSKYGLRIPGTVQTYHPAHQAYLRRPSLNSLDYFFEVLDAIDEETRENMLEFAAHDVVNPRFRKPAVGDETLRELMLDALDYGAFRERCYELSSLRLSENFLVRAIMLETLAWAWRLADTAEAAAALARHSEMLAEASTHAEAEEDERERATLERVIVFLRERVNSAADQQRTWAAYYGVLCEKVLPRLALEEPLLIDSALDALRRT